MPRQVVHPSVTLRYDDHICWNTWISLLIRLKSSLAADSNTVSLYSPKRTPRNLAGIGMKYGEVVIGVPVTLFRELNCIPYIEISNGIARFPCDSTKGGRSLSADGVWLDEGYRRRSFWEISLWSRRIQDNAERAFDLPSEPLQRGWSVRPHPWRPRTHGVRRVRQLDTGCRPGHRSSRHA